MTMPTPDLASAYAALGLEPPAGPDAAKSAFRKLVKRLHPDACAPSPQSLQALAAALAAIRAIEAAAPFCVTLELTPAQATRGVTRTIAARGRNLIVRAPPGAAHGDILTAIGDPQVQVILSVRGAETNATTSPDCAPGADTAALAGFVSRFAAPSAAARFAAWVRGSRPAA